MTITSEIEININLTTFCQGLFKGISLKVPMFLGLREIDIFVRCHSKLFFPSFVSGVHSDLLPLYAQWALFKRKQSSFKIRTVTVATGKDEFNIRGTVMDITTLQIRYSIFGTLQA